MTNGQIRVLDHSIDRTELRAIAQEGFGDMVKGVVDIEGHVLALGGELHADIEAVLLGKGSLQENLWGINLYPDITGDDWVEFDSMINIRPAQGNRSRSVEDPIIREKIIAVVHKYITD